MKDYVGFGALSEALQALSESGYAKVLVVASATGWKRFDPDGHRPFFSQRETRMFTGFSPNPEIMEIMAGVAAYRGFSPDVVVALGGGSAIDVAKMIKGIACTREPFDPAEPEQLQLSGDGPPLVAIATTSGSGSEATQFAVFYRGIEKQSLAHPSLRPESAVVDPELTYSLPPHQTACTGFDALSQSVEAFWSSNTSPEVREFASASIRYALGNLPPAVHAPAPDNRYNMAMAAYLSGKAIDHTRTTMPHALAYHITKVYGLPHGHAVALTLPYFFLLNTDPALPLNSPLGPEGHRKNMENLFELLGQKTAADCFAFWRALLKECGLASTLIEIGMDTEAKVRAMVESMNTARQRNMPVHIEPEHLIAFFMEHP